MSAPLVLPDGGLYALTWSIPRQFGGLTKSLLQRSCQLATASGRDVTVITLAAQPDLDDDRASLRERGLLVDGVSILNLWEELGRTDDNLWADVPFDPDVTMSQLHGPADDVGEIRRPDGTLLARQRWQTLGDSPTLTRRGDEVVRTELFDRDETFRGGWHGVWPLWRWWLDSTLPRPAHVVVDSANVADCFAAAPLPDLPMTYVVHNSHVSGAREAPYGRLARWRSFTMIRANRFDAVVYLTHAQHRDFELLFGAQDNAHVVPHAIETNVSDPKRKRPAGRGIVMANLDARKRVDHAVRAVAIASERAGSVELNIYGRGEEHEAVLAEIDELGAPARLEGYTSDPAGAFADSSYMLLTSKHEGFGLVLVEAMAAGCLPIAYDIEYGLADIVNHGDDGFLVTRADEKELAARVTEVAQASWWRLRRMRKAARRRAADFLPQAVLPTWGPVLETAAEHAAARAGEPEPSLPEVRELERVAGLHRFLDCRLDATITDVMWDDDSVATVVVSCVLTGAGNCTDPPEVDVELVHRPTGRRSAPPPVERVAAGPSSDERATVLRITLDPSTVDQPADHVVVLRARVGGIDVIDTPQPPDDAPIWLPLSKPATSRPVLIPGRRTGLRLVTAGPRAVASAKLASDHVLLDVTALENGGRVQTVEAAGLDGSRTIEAVRLPDGRHRITVDQDGAWKVRARIVGRWRDIAWQGPDEVPGAEGPLHLELSPRGYIRLRRGDPDA